MELLEQIKNAGIVGCGGAGFPTHVKLNCEVEYLIINAAECEPLLRTDRYLMLNAAQEVITTIEKVAKMTKAKKVCIALKETYHDEIASLKEVIEKSGSIVELFLLKNFYPAGDEQIMVLEVTGRTVPPSGIPLDVGAVVSNVATMYSIYEASCDVVFTEKYLTVTGAVQNPIIVKAPLGTSLAQCIEAAGGVTVENYHILIGGPLMGKVYPKEELEQHFVTKTTSGVVIVPDEAHLVKMRETPLRHIQKRAKGSCIQCQTCTQMCPRYLSGHPLSPHKIMRKMAYVNDVTTILNDPDVQEVMTCSECGVCEAYACPMGLAPRQVNIYIKNELRKSGFKYEKDTETTFRYRQDREYRRIPSHRIAARLGVEQYYDYTIRERRTLTPDKVTISLQQHIGAPAEPVVAVGDYVKQGSLIGEIPPKALGARVHASIAGKVTKIENGFVTIEK
ncbi:4Fe-4S dicluster domain-containing protein [Eubacterium oxidoreducens]|uniref:Na+-translocating ferredoxin:NAD+ oxidoreductase RNF, RnfC subunit n=1 Tax=Eubacterium oxidoreducens TaxID=1732 RepID=A0A1G6BRI5_EUBOX|nr:4Fe-4S dicluster domain-containing protein [Eubacterium oxidoreducens]SDB23239.1 Na+-translocating ferredoxin:NAD+ oxidoreductase RNF, RnfC subunit [Eubacterium oxidoreducens]